ncbi:MAG: hypothetical protein PHR66_02915 [Desulfuromonadaceae bacterium]|nr:hypothetical protein [Desulfuromonadaceae bacterium]
MEETQKDEALRGREQGSCSRLVTVAGFMLLVIGLSLLAGGATAGESKVEPANSGIGKGLEKWAKFVPARYDKPEVFTKSDASLFEIERAAPPAAPVVKGEAPAAAPSSATTVEKGKDAARAAEGNKHGTSAKE